MDIAAMTPIGKKAPASTKDGASGHALAVTLIKRAEAKGEREAKEGESMKATLLRLTKMTRECHLAFRAELVQRRQLIADVAKGMGIGVTEYIKGDPVSNSVYTAVSEWTRLSEACEAGFTPNLELAWGTIKMNATDVLAAKAAPVAPVKPGEPVTVQTSNPIAKKKRGREAKPNLDKAIALLDTFPLQDLEQVAAWLQKRLEKVSPAKAGVIKPAPVVAPTTTPRKGGRNAVENAIAASMPNSLANAGKTA